MRARARPRPPWSRRSRPSSGTCRRAGRRTPRATSPGARTRSPVSNQQSPSLKPSRTSLLLGGLLVGVAVERRPVGHLRQQQSDLAGAAPCAACRRRAARARAGLLVVLDHRVRQRADAGRPVDVEGVDERDVALAGAVELDDPGDPEPASVNSSQISGRRPVADHQPDPVVPVAGLLRLVEQVAAQLADVDERGGPLARDLVPEPRRRELAAEREVAPAAEHGRQRDRQRVVVIERQAAVQGVVGAQPDAEAAEPGHALEPADSGSSRWPWAARWCRR